MYKIAIDLRIMWENLTYFKGKQSFANLIENSQNCHMENFRYFLFTVSYLIRV